MPPKVKSEAQKQQAKRQILDAARELILTQGIETLTMREIAKKIAYSPTTIYLYFKDKESLIRELCIADFKTLTLELNRIMAIQEPVARLLALGSAYAEFALSYPNHYRMMFMATRPKITLQENEVDPGLEAYQLLNKVVNDVYFAKKFKDELRYPELIAQTIWAAIHGVCSLEINLGCEKHINWSGIAERIKLMQDILVCGLLKDSALEHGD